MEATRWFMHLIGCMGSDCARAHALFWSIIVVPWYSPSCCANTVIYNGVTVFSDLETAKDLFQDKENNVIYECILFFQGISFRKDELPSSNESEAHHNDPIIPCAVVHDLSLLKLFIFLFFWSFIQHSVTSGVNPDLVACSNHFLKFAYWKQGAMTI